ncbi:hypothetical protein [Agromyces lapidis]|uniref:Uncharacterized protein n=1 Tax=Agromyces lapidis TaxID=279574 RepID=A0ABV5SMP9_9MICO|nr:hypothetical protein [Agromyces lapidis]
MAARASISTSDATTNAESQDVGHDASTTPGASPESSCDSTNRPNKPLGKQPTERPGARPAPA